MNYKSQYQQDEILDIIFDNKNNGIFVDIGSHDGVRISNSYYFEKYRNWTGLCVEPLPEVFNELVKNRTCYCENYAIMDKEGECAFLQVEGEPDQLSGILDKVDIKRIDEEISIVGGSKKIINVKTIELHKLLSKYDIKYVNFMSIDVEGSELEVLKSIDFNKVFIEVLLIENNNIEYTHEYVIPYIEKFGFEYICDIECDILCIHHRSNIKI